MTIRKINEEINQKGEGCSSRDHDLPGMVNLQPGNYEHVCNACGARKTFTVNKNFAKSN